MIIPFEMTILDLHEPCPHKEFHLEIFIFHMNLFMRMSNFIESLNIIFIVSEGSPFTPTQGHFESFQKEAFFACSGPQGILSFGSF